jgi:putative NADH-flavin reductase
MKLAIFGASGATGRLLVQQALAAGHDVTVLLRSAGSLTLEGARLQRIVGQLDNPDTVAAVVQGADAVISVLGVRKSGSPTVCTDAIRSILQAMYRTGVLRLVALSAYGALETQHDSWLIRLIRKIISAKMRDKDGMETLVRASSMGWTLVRPPALTNGATTGNFRAGTGLRPGVAGLLSRSDLAGFMLKVAESGDYLHQAPIVSM